MEFVSRALTLVCDSGLIWFEVEVNILTGTTFLETEFIDVVFREFTLVCASGATTFLGTEMKRMFWLILVTGWGPLIGTGRIVDGDDEMLTILVPVYGLAPIGL